MNNTTEGVPSLKSYILGSAITVSAFVVVMLNVLVIAAIVRHGFFKGHSGSMYKLSCNLLAADSVHIICDVLYLGPASAMQSWILPEGWPRKLPSYLPSIGWRCILLTLCALAVNRYVAVCKPNLYGNIFSADRTKLIIASSWLIAIALILIGEFLMPCCSSYLYFKIYSFAQLSTDYNYSNSILGLPINISVSVFIIIVYSLVIWNIRINNNKVIDSINNQNARKRRRREVWYAVQLTVVNAIFMAVWLLYQILSKTLPADQADSGIFSSVIFVDILNAGSDALVFITLSNEVRGALRKLLNQESGVSSGTFGMAVCAAAIPAAVAAGSGPGAVSR